MARKLKVGASAKRASLSKDRSKSSSCIRLELVLALLVFFVVATHFLLIRRHDNQVFLVDRDHAGSSPPPESQKSSIPPPPQQSTPAAPPKNHNDLPKVLAIVFPQYHSDPLNDRLWGQGFTDWDNLRAAPTHNRLGLEIPRPTELGYYDLTLPATRQRQAQLAREHGVDGFVYHHYWFYDPARPGPTLAAPLEAMLRDDPNPIDFFFNWCDSSWTDTWLGKATKDGQSSTGTGNKELQKQYFPDENDPAIRAHYDWLKRFFRLPSYLKVQGQPVFMVHQRKPSSYPLVKQLRRLAIEDGFPGLYLLMGMSFTHSQLFAEGVDQGQRRHRYPKDSVNQTVAYPYPLDWMSGKSLQVPQWCQQAAATPKNILPEVPGVLTSFDNTPRRDSESAHLWSPDPPDVVVKRFGESLHAAIYYQACCNPRRDAPFVLINSMNEWAEGMALEPSTVFGRRLLETVKSVKEGIRCRR